MAPSDGRAYDALVRRERHRADRAQPATCRFPARPGVPYGHNIEGETLYTLTQIRDLAGPTRIAHLTLARQPITMIGVRPQYPAGPSSRNRHDDDRDVNTTSTSIARHRPSRPR